MCAPGWMQARSCHLGIDARIVAPAVVIVTGRLILVTPAQAHCYPGKVFLAFSGQKRWVLAA
jgi:hypothetical protein